MGWHEDKIYELEQETKKARQETEKFQAQERLLVAERELMVTRSTDGLLEAEAQRRQALDLKRLELWGHALPYLTAVIVTGILAMALLGAAVFGVG